MRVFLFFSIAKCKSLSLYLLKGSNETPLKNLLRMRFADICCTIKKSECNWYYIKRIPHLLLDVEQCLDFLLAICITSVTLPLAVQRIALVACRTACFNMQRHKCWTATPSFDATNVELCINGYSNKLLVLIKLNVALLPSWPTVACKSCKVCKCLSVSLPAVITSRFHDNRCKLVRFAFKIPVESLG